MISYLEIQFTYIPSGAEIISLDAFNRSESEDDFVIGVTIIKDGGGQYLNIYSDLDVMIDHKPFQLENLAQNCVSLLLDFIPYQLTHCRVSDCVVWLLAGSDNKIHVYSEDKDKHMYLEVDSANILPEFNRHFPSVPLWTDVAAAGDCRVTATCCESGVLVMTRINTSDNTGLQTWEKQFDSPLSSVRLFSISPPTMKLPSFMNSPVSTRDNTRDISSNDLHLVVTALGQSQVFHNVVDHDLSRGRVLPESDGYDVVTCSCVADVAMTGTNCVLLGTYGHMILCYTLHTDHWTLQWSRSVSAPVLGLRCEDVTGDGVREIVVVTSKGVQVLQPQLDNVKKLTIERLKTLVKSFSNGK